MGIEERQVLEMIDGREGYEVKQWGRGIVKVTVRKNSIYRNCGQCRRDGSIIKING